MNKFVLLIVTFFSFYQLFAQQADSDLLLTIDGKKIPKEEFIRLYTKNKTNITTGEVTSVPDYLELFINFQLKVLEAEKLGYDTLSSFINELKGYREQLARPYLIDKESNDLIIKEAYERMLLEVRASHILVEVFPDALPDDTLFAYDKALAIRTRIINGEPFEYVAKGASDDKSVKYNGGDLGYFTVFEMVYPFENAVYQMNIGDISMPVRTQFGYHIIKKTDSRKSNGQVKVAHIMLLTPQGIVPSDEQRKKEQINELYHRLKKGEDFIELAKQFSEDRGSSRNGGDLPWFGVGRMVPEFEKAAFELKLNGDISLPVKTSFGWHIIKRIDRKEIGTFAEMEAELKFKAGKDQRIEIARTALINKLKNENGFKIKSSNIPYYYDINDNKLLITQKYLDPNYKHNDTLIIYQNKVVREKDFITYLHRFVDQSELRPDIYKKAFDQFIENIILDTENQNLEKKYPEFKYTIKEYHDGILYFEITDDQVWSRATGDSVGISKYYNEHKENYLWDEKFDGSVYYCSNEKVFKKVSKLVNKYNFGTKVKNDDLLKKFNSENNEQLKIVTSVFGKGENENIDFYAWKLGQSGNNNYVLVKGKLIPKQQKTLDEAKGQVISDYQTFIESEWTNELRNKYKVEINQSILSKIK
ncbi:MAG: hypothetical protein A2W99_06880 [Bacteroidetes bacterium GWF2_33_16]|nr:MAG: hypothetical protein A2X00_07005 [Bacteroidetes bacterium GWE2_32_14]OFY02779.1 MAG: hypothetical protein A2W99_06880 [Bacteroidetes bacterium GWF2_33_16]